MFVGTRLIASGATLLASQLVTVLKDLQVPGEGVDSYVKPVLRPCPIVERPTNLVTIGALVTDAVRPV